ncbi:MAG TPA: response regulator transcription factor [Pyrinomonadaceae bacterium]|jgi:two-component system NarL family response regulator
MRILIVEDNPKMRRLLRIFLSDVADVCECSDGDEVITAYSDWKPAWVVMDVQMARVGGITATRLLKNAFPESRVVMLSEHDDSETRAAALEAGALDYLIKDDLTVLRCFLLETEI